MLINKDNFEQSLEAFTPVLVADTETTGFDVWNTDKLFSIGVCTTREETFYYPFRQSSERFPLLAGVEGDLNLPLEYLPHVFDKIAESDVLIGHNIKFDLAAMSTDGYVVPVDQKLEDTVSSARLFFKDKFDRLDLQNCVAHLFPEEDLDKWKTGFKEYLKKAKCKNFSEAHPMIVAEYCERDCLMTWRIRNKLEEYIVSTDQMIVWEQEKRLTKTLWEMELEGLKFDREYCVRKLPQIELKLATLAAEIFEICKKEFDILSNPQLSSALNGIGIHAAFKGKKRKDGTALDKWDSAELLSLESPVGGKILEFRGIDKMRSTYFEPLLKWTDDRQHPSFKSSGAITGRMSCNNPNLQNLSNKSILLEGNKYDEEAVEALKALLGARGSGGERMQMTNKGGGVTGGGTFSNIISSTSKFEDSDNSVSVKKLYVAPEGFNMILIDFNQMEMRVFSDYVKDDSMKEVLENQHFDFHAYVAQEVWKVHPGHNLWKFYRTLAKAINFGLIYGIGTDKLAQQIQKSKEEAQQYRFEYFSRFPKANGFMKTVQKVVEGRGWIKNRFGRRYFIDRDRAYTGVNYLVQGTSADIVKNRMNAVNDYLHKEKLKSKLVVQVHDELVFYVAEDEMQIVKELKDIIEYRLIDTFLPTEVEMGFPSWAEKAPICSKCLNKLSKQEKEGEVIHQCQ